MIFLLGLAETSSNLLLPFLYSAIFSSQCVLSWLSPPHSAWNLLLLVSPLRTLHSEIFGTSSSAASPLVVKNMQVHQSCKAISNVVKCSQVERRKTHISNVVKTIPGDGYRKIQDDMKLKNDQFNDLKLRFEFRTSELKWKIERLHLHHKISGLEWDLRAKSVSYDLLVIKQGICKLSLTIKLDKEKLYEYMFEKCRGQQSKIVQKDNELVNLRYVLAEMDILFEGMQLKNHELRQQKEDILKELQKERAASLQSLSKLKKRLFNLQKEHGSCSTKLELKETEWRSQLEILKAGAGYSDAYSTLLCENKNMLGESSKRKQMLFEECVMKIEEVSECEMAEKTHEPLSWKNDDEVPESSFEGQLEIEQASDQEIENLKSAVKEHEEKIGDLQHQVTSLELISPVKDDATYTMVEEQNL